MSKAASPGPPCRPRDQAAARIAPCRPIAVGMSKRPDQPLVVGEIAGHRDLTAAVDAAAGGLRVHPVAVVAPVHELLPRSSGRPNAAPGLATRVWKTVISPRSKACAEPAM